MAKKTTPTKYEQAYRADGLKNLHAWVPKDLVLRAQVAEGQRVGTVPNISKIMVRGLEMVANQKAEG